MTMMLNVAGGIVLAGVSLGSASAAVAQEASPVGAGSPTILIDAGHYNFVSGVDSHADWLGEQGLRIQVLCGIFDEKSLTGVDVVMIASPSAPNNAVTEPWLDEKFAVAWQPPFPSAFSHDEIELLRDWVVAGGGLVVVFDHMPVSNSVEALTAAFGVEVANGHAFDETKLSWEDGRLVRKEAGAAVFRRSDGTLAAHPITQGRVPAERIDSVALGGGAAFRPTPEGRMLLELGASFVSLNPAIPWRFREDTPRQAIGGWWQGGVLRVGRGRLAVFSDLGILATHEEVAEGQSPWDVWQLQNPQLFLNTLRWLAGEIEPDE
jgi:hypothetical protein